jgi:hypothetical protein
MNNIRQNLITDDAVKTFKYRNSTEIFELIVAFENCTLPLEKWTHISYLTIVFWYVYMNPLPEARRLIRDGLRRYIFEHNITTTISGTKYKVLTPLLVRKVNNYLKQNKGTDFFVNLANEFFLGIKGEKTREDTSKELFYVANSKRAGSNKYKFISN